MQNIKILIATHKAYEFPKDSIYLPIQVGKAISQNTLGILGDNTGNNISTKNNSFCELTALYWAWKNSFLDDSHYIGLVHYRRYFQGSSIQLKGKMIAGKEELLSYLNQYDAIVPKKRNYYIESVYNHYKNAHYIKDLELVREIIEQDYLNYLVTFDNVMKGKTLHLFNMFILNKEHFEQYCEWLFDILFKVENKIEISSYNNYQKRVFGFLSERLFNVWLIANNLNIKEVKVVNLEPENIWLKAINFLKRKFIKSQE